MTDIEDRPDAQRGAGDQAALVHRLPPAQVVDRIGYLSRLATGRRVVHVGFADAGFRELQMGEGTWLHDHLGRVADSLVGIDLDDVGVREAERRGLEAHVADCCDTEAVRALAIEPGDLVLAGEIIEHVDRPGDLLDGLRVLCRADGLLAITTPNAYGWVNPLAALAGVEVNHPDHVGMFTWFTLTNLLARHGWEPVGAATYVPTVKALADPGMRGRLTEIGARAVVGLQRGLARVRPFVADGLIVLARPGS